MKYRVVTAVLSLGCQAACNTDGTVCAGSVVYDEPIIRIAAVTDATSGATVSPITISQIRLNAVDLPAISFEPPPGLLNASVSNSQVLCNVACAFGRNTGTYSFSVEAPGYTTKQVSVDANYSRVTTACEQHASGATEVRITLQKL